MQLQLQLQLQLGLLLIIAIIADSYRCVNFYGLETPEKKFVCSWQHDPAWYLDKMKKLINLDSVRLPFSYEYASCSDFKEMDSFIEACDQRNITVILDYHRGYADHQGPSPVEQLITQEMWIDLLVAVLDRYETKKSVVAISLFNEFQITNTSLVEEMQLEAIDAIEMAFPNRYHYMVSCIDWGKDCSSMWKTLPNNHTFVEVHSYGFSAGKLPSPGVKIFIGEIGWRKNETKEFQIFKSLMKRRRIKDMCLWTIAHSRDTDNLFKDDCETANDFIVDSFNSLFTWTQPQCLRGMH